MKTLHIENVCGYDVDEKKTKGVVLALDDELYHIVWIHRVGFLAYHIAEEYQKNIIGEFKLTIGKRNKRHVEKQIMKKVVDIIYQEA